MCGFFGIIFENDNKNIGNILVKAGMRLSYRGYDSTGAAVVKINGKYDLKKDAGTVEEVSKKYNFSDMTGYKGITQLRWATYGKPNKKNAQPHIDCEGAIISAHNGNIINTHNLMDMLKKNGHNVRSENDGEVIPHLVEQNMKRKDAFNAILKSTSAIKGDYAFVLTPTDSAIMYAFKKGSSMFAGLGDGFVCVSSDYTAVLDLTSKVLRINDNELITFTYNSYKIYNIKEKTNVKRSFNIDKTKPVSSVKEPFKSFMEKELMEVPSKVKKLISSYKDGILLNKLKKDIKREGIVITGSGTSYNASMLGTYFLNRISNTDVQLYYPSDIIERFQHIKPEKKHLVVVSQSGETKDIKNAIDIFRCVSSGKVFSMLNNINSTMGYLSDVNLPTYSDTEVSVPATKTFINQVVLFYIMAHHLKGEKMATIEKKIESLAENIKHVLDDRMEDIEHIAKKLYKEKFFHILGYSLTFPVALEGALKMKEVNYINVEPMHSSEFKHGPLALVTKNYPIIIISTKKDKHYTLSHINEIKTREGYVITISQNDEDIKQNSDYNLSVDVDDENQFAILSALVMQILSLKIAYLKNIDPDKPRNISKTITVD